MPTKDKLSNSNSSVKSNGTLAQGIAPLEEIEIKTPIHGLHSLIFNFDTNQDRANKKVLAYDFMEYVKKWAFVTGNTSEAMNVETITNCIATYVISLVKNSKVPRHLPHQFIILGPLNENDLLKNNEFIKVRDYLIAEAGSKE